MRQTRTVAVVSEEQGEVDKSRKWGLANTLLREAYQHQAEGAEEAAETQTACLLLHHLDERWHGPCGEARPEASGPDHETRRTETRRGECLPGFHG